MRSTTSGGAARRRAPEADVGPGESPGAAPAGRRPAPILTTVLAAALAVAGLAAWPAGARAQVTSDLAEAFGRAVVGVAGTEAQGTWEFDYLGTHVRIDILGLVFCTPPDVWAPPDPSPVPPLTAYGCVSSPRVEAEVPPAGDTARITLGLDVIFVDLATTRSRSILCGEFSGGSTVSADGYMLTSGVVISDWSLSSGGACLQAALVPGSVQLTLGDVDADLQDSCLMNYWGAMADGLLPDLEAAIESGMADLIASRSDAFNGELCTLTPVRDSSWGRVKGLYGAGWGAGR